MNRPRIVAWLIGGWFGLSLLMALVATQNFRAVDRLLAAPSPQAAERIGRLGPGETRLLLRHQASELNRYFFRRSEEAQIFLWALVLILVRERRARLLASCVMAALLAEFLLLTPRIVEIGRAMDFAPQAAQRAAFWKLHGAYSTLEVVKWAVGAWLSGRLFWAQSDAGMPGASLIPGSRRDR